MRFFIADDSDDDFLSFSSTTSDDDEDEAGNGYADPSSSNPEHDDNFCSLRAPRSMLGQSIRDIIESSSEVSEDEAELLMRTWDILESSDIPGWQSLEK